MKQLLLISCIAVASIVFTSCGNKHAEKPAQQADTTKVAAPVQQDTVSFITAVFIDSVFHADPGTATRQYKDKPITVRGEIRTIHQHSKSRKKHTGLSSIMLLTGNKDASSHVTCTSSDANFTRELKTGQEVTIKGICNGIIKHNVQIKECEVVQ